MNNNGIKFLPLYWIYHDNWINRNWGYDYYHGWRVSNTSRHMGHLHFFMPGYEFGNSSQGGQAYSGKQTYEFSLKSIWGPGSGDKNQYNDVKFVGSPKWYFEIIEYWRRVYIQPWDNKNKNDNIIGIVGKTGIKWDASHKNHTYGPFREGQNFFFYWNKSARTLPIEYYLDENKRTRNNYLYGNGPWYLPVNINYDISNSTSDYVYMKKEYKSVITPFFIPNGDNDGGYVDRPICYRINRTTSDYSITEERFKKWKNIADEIGATFRGVDRNGNSIIGYSENGYHTTLGESNSSSDSYLIPFGAFNVSCADHRYIYPIIEYQSVKHLNWERLPGWAQRDRDEGGDGFTIKIELPYSENDKIQSPFSNDNGVVSPIGTYHHGFDVKHSDKIPRYPYCDKVDIGRYQWVIVNRSSGDYGETYETFVRIIVSTESPKDLPEGEYIASKAPYEKGYLTDEKGRPIYARLNNIRTDEYRIPEAWKDNVMSFNVPGNMKSDGVWVEQCFGGVVRAKAVVTIEDKFGEVKDVEVSSTKFFLAEQFEGSDQNAPSNKND